MSTRMEFILSTHKLKEKRKLEIKIIDQHSNQDLIMIPTK